MVYENFGVGFLRVVGLVCSMLKNGREMGKSGFWADVREKAGFVRESW